MKLLRRLALLLCLLVSANVSLPICKMAGANEATLPLPVLGLSITPEGDAYRVVGLKGEQLAEGDLAHCERARLAALRERHGPGRFNIPFPTLGGKAVWADEVVLSGWRIQRTRVLQRDQGVGTPQ